MATFASDSAPASQPKAASPALERRNRLGRAVYAVVWAMLLAAAVTAAIGSMVLTVDVTRNQAFVPLGITGRVSADAVTVTSVRSGEARRAGLAAGDRIVAVDAKPLPFARHSRRSG